MSFETRLKSIAQDVDTLLEQLLPASGSRAPRVIDAMRYSSLGQGKRLRPFFVVESASLFGVERAQALRVGVALECIHCYSLVHDDLPAMDDDDLRRGKPTAHIAFDEATAILAGDGLLTFAFEILGDAKTHPDGAVRSNLVLALAKAAGADGMVGGQMLDLAAETASRPLTLDEIITLQAMKTGALFRYSLESGAILAQAKEADRLALVDYAETVGLAFQIADDLLDAEGDAETTGKRTGKDAEAGKATFVSLMGLEGARAKARSLVEDACAALEPFGKKAETLREAARFIVERKS
ncbi:farnesyl diphosphate synthase [Rhodoligotrophos appendicifer]|uniref:polyprenyl synthetase family protein n=1 Tax=Rhodoligotrophos appendicifer TaxID=987056 RepID=UPI0011869991|nr:farnesyl diphosphate synthase [Rhodoligotrophos appendicifer]